MSLPETFTPFERVDIGSNVLIGGKIPIAFESAPILLIGKGAEPKIWLGTPQKDHTIRYLVEGSEPRSSRIRVVHKGDAVSIYFDDMIIVQMVKKNENEVTV